MATKKKKVAKKRALKKKVSKKKKSVKKKKSTKKKTSRKKVQSGKISVEVKKGGRVDNGKKFVWSVVIKGKGGSIPGELVTASNKTEALKKAKRILKKSLM